MRWDDLFADLHAQIAEDERRELDAEIADRTRRERAQVALVQRLADNVGARLTLTCAGDARVDGVISDIGADWVLLDHGGAASLGQILVPLPALRSLSGLPPRSAPLTTVVSRLRLGTALRAISRDRSAVTCVDVEGRQQVGTIDAVGEDFVDLSSHPLDVARREDAVRSVVTIPTSSIALIRHRL